MKILAFDTSSENLILAFCEGEAEWAEYELPASSAKHSEALMPAIEDLLKKNKASVEDLDAVAVGLGPGSFTGLRIGTTCAKMIGYSSGARLIGISTLEIIARNLFFKNKGRIAVMLDARRSQVYGAVYESSRSKFSCVQAPALLGLDQFLSKVKGPAIWTGAASSVEKEKILAFGKNRFQVADPHLLNPSASGLAEASVFYYQKKKFTKPKDLTPLYLRPKDCNATKK